MSLLAPAQNQPQQSQFQQNQIQSSIMNLSLASNLESNNSSTSMTNELPIFEQTFSSFVPSFLAAHLSDNSSSNSHVEDRESNELDLQRNKQHQNESLNNGPSDGLTNMSLLEMPMACNLRRRKKDSNLTKRFKLDKKDLFLD